MRFRFFPRSRSKKVLLLVLVAMIALAGWWFSGPLLARYELRQGQALYERREFQKALVRFESAVEWQSDFGEARFWLARTNRRLGRWDAAREDLKTAQSLSIAPNRITRERQLALAQSGQMQLAEKNLQELLLEPRDDGREILEAYVQGFLHIGQPEPAIGLINAWKADFPEDSQPHFLLGMIERRRGRHGLAVAAFDAAIERNSNRLDARRERGRAYFALHKYKQAEQDWRTCLQPQRDNDELRLWLARALIPRLHTKEARRLLDSIAEDSQHFVAARVELARLDIDAGQATQALERLNPIAEENSHNVEFRETLASALVATKAYNAARKHQAFVAAARSAFARIRNLRQQAARHPRDVAPKLEIARLRLQYGPRAEAVIWINRVLALNPNHPEARKLLLQYNRSSETRGPGR